MTNREHGDAGKSRRLLIIGWNYIVSERSVDLPLIEFEPRPRPAARIHGVSDEDPVIRNVRIISWICALSPILTIGLFTTLGVHVWMGLGRWPIPTEGYSSTLFHFHTMAVMLWCVAAFFGAPPVWVAGVIVGWRHPGMLRTFGLQVIVFAIGWALIYTMAVWNPGGFVEWFWD